MIIGSNADCQLAVYDGLHCNDLTDDDLPGVSQEFAGHYARLVMNGNNFTRLSASSFPGITFDWLILNGNMALRTIEAGFLEAPQLVRDMECQGNLILEQFPFDYMAEFTSLQHVSIGFSSIKEIPANITWPNSVMSIELDGHKMVKMIENFAFSRAVSLKSLSLIGELFCLRFC